MPASMAARSTVVPLGTDSWRPSIVRVTRSISSKFYLRALFPLEVRQRRVVDVGFYRTDRAGEREPELVGRLIRDGEEFRGLAVGIGDADGHGNVENLARLLKRDDQLVAFHRRAEA